MQRHTALILAIEPDQRQAARLARLISRRFDAELIVADTTQRALAAIGTRIPELVLIPPLLSPQDEARLITTFRANAAAAHVEILTMPVLTSPEPQTPQRRFLPRRKKSADTHSDADDTHASAFGDQIASCLERLAEEREAFEGASRSDSDEHAPSDVMPSPDVQSDDIAEPNGPVALQDRDIAHAALASSADALAGAGASRSLDPDQYSFAALVYRLRASTRTAQELR